MIYWDWIGAFFYVFLGIVGYRCLKKVKQKESFCQRKQKLNNRYYIIWFVVWLIATVFRVVSVDLGGSDAVNYVHYFNNCLEPIEYQNQYAVRADIGFRLICKLIRLFTDDYHIFFFIVYGICIYSTIYLFNEFAFSKNNAIPYILAFYIHLLGFSAIRTNLSMAFLFFALVFLKKKKNFFCIVSSIVCLLIHKASIIYIAAIVFYKVYTKKEMKVKHIVQWMIVTVLVGEVAQQFLLRFGNSLFDSGVYVKYVQASAAISFFQDFWKLALGQLLLLGSYVFLYRKIEKDILTMNDEDIERYKLIKILCIYDFIMIPVCFMLNVWRGYQYFFFIRLIMWGEVFKVGTKLFKKDNRMFLHLILTLIIIAYFVFRVGTMYKSSALLPYIFDPFNKVR